MDRATQERIFEPFFTTKEVGKGTGLGLAMVYGAIQQHGGFIEVRSAPGAGASFDIYLPLSPDGGARAREEQAPAAQAGSETLLLVEDDATVRMVEKALLEDLGYRVIEALDGEHAVALFRERKDEVRLVVSDVIMPGLSGGELLGRLRELRPDVGVLFVSGYTADILRKKGIEGGAIDFISKPLRPDTLSIKIREALDNRGPRREG